MKFFVMRDGRHISMSSNMKQMWCHSAAEVWHTHTAHTHFMRCITSLHIINMATHSVMLVQARTITTWVPQLAASTATAEQQPCPSSAHAPLCDVPLRQVAVLHAPSLLLIAPALLAPVPLACPSPASPMPHVQNDCAVSVRAGHTCLYVTLTPTSNNPITTVYAKTHKKSFILWSRAPKIRSPIHHRQVNREVFVLVYNYNTSNKTHDLSSCVRSRKNLRMHYFCSWGMKLTTHLQLLPRLRMHGGPLPLSSINLQDLHRDNFTFTVVLSLSGLTIQYVTSSF